MAETKKKNGVTYKKSSSGRWFRAGGAAARAGGQRVTPADYVRLGPEGAQLKAQTPAKDWANIVKAAHKQGWTVRSAIDTGVPAELKQKTQKSVRAAAQRQIDEAYKPALAELEGSETQNAGLRQKRLADQQSFDQWSAQQASQVAQKMNEAQDKYEAAIKAGSDARVKDATAVAQGFAGKAGAGGISDLSGSVANADVNRTQQATTERAHAATDYAAAQRPIVAERAAAIPTAALGSASQRHAQIEGDFAKALEGTTKERAKLLTNRAADHAKAYADLMKTEMDKAASNRDFAGLQAQIKSKEQIAKEDSANYRLGLKVKSNIAAAGNRTSVTVANISADAKRADRDARASENALDRSLKASIEGAKLKAAGVKDAKAQSQANVKIMAPVETIANILKTQQRGKGGKKGGSGYLYDPKSKTYKLARQVLLGMQASAAQIDAGLAHARGHLLTQRQKQALGLL